LDIEFANFIASDISQSILFPVASLPYLIKKHQSDFQGLCNEAQRKSIDWEISEATKLANSMSNRSGTVVAQPNGEIDGETGTDISVS
jgi:hypothetical protein